MIGEEVIRVIENWAPPGAAWEKDNVGLQVGSPKQKITNIFLCLELTDKAINEAIRKKANFIFTHHPFLFKPLKKINTHFDPKSKLVEKLIKNDITLYSAHTNLDFTKEGVSFELGNKLKLENLTFLEYEKDNQVKLVVFVPEPSLTKVSEALFKAGAGKIGEYSNCSFISSGIGSFRGSQNSNPNIGMKGNLELVDEIRLEVIVNSWNLGKVVNALNNAHPYEEPAFDLYPLQNSNVNFGFGVIGSLQRAMSKNEFLKHVCKSLKTDNVRYTVGKKNKIKKVAVCGGSGSDLLASAIKKGADAFVTADIKYHTFQDAENNILFIDAGHYETEIHALERVKIKLENLIKSKGEPVKVIKFSGSTNPVKFFNNKGVK